ncbi:MAG: glutaconyl-CoA/methylmalonyl-CoA decarboxylase subunit gamma [Thermosipho sp. (in: thermotogales)]|nr:glutaconyl-CoA/methylmalonyl-CoA decarboxylase subunit gamma [Thermosipho sp. (in: thermotogales)]MDN5324579.1 glutaconyl-CoA/methylmalonyl-CoA decarboxylase subunit gamma [Thermosipho sp. (in: thermotogales)]
MVRKFKVRLNGKEYLVEVEEITSINQTKKPQETKNTLEDQQVKSVTNEPTKKGEVREERTEKKEESVSTGKVITTPMSGIILKIFVSPGQKINAGDNILILEAMKMENEIKADTSGIVKSVLVKEGDAVETGQVLVELE